MKMAPESWLAAVVVVAALAASASGVEIGPEAWVAIAFLAFVLLAGRAAWTAATGALDRRSAKIKDELDEAVRLREEAQTLLATYQRRQRDAVKEAEEILEHAREEAARMATEAEENLRAALARRAEAAQEKIARAESRAVDEVRDAAVELVLAATRKIIAERLDEETGNALVEDAIRDVADKLH